MRTDGAAKAAIAHYTRYLAQDLGPFGITVNCIAAGVIDTGRIMATVIPGSVQSNRDRAELVALRQLGTVEDCAKFVEFLATDLSDYVTGAVIPIDGGLPARIGKCSNVRPALDPKRRGGPSRATKILKRLARGLGFEPRLAESESRAIGIFSL